VYNLSTAEYNRLKAIINKIAHKHGFNFDDFLSYCDERIAKLCKRYDPQKNDSFINYASTSLKLYALNFRRDCLYPSSVPRKILGYHVEYNNLFKRGWSPKIISHKLGVPLQLLEQELEKLRYFSYENIVSITSIEYQI